MANFNFNRVILGGRLVAKPELKVTPSGVSVASFRVAVRRNGKDEATDFFEVSAWRQTAEFVTKFFDKGSSICIIGKIQTRSWEDQNGNKRYSTEILADEVSFVDSRTENVPTEKVTASEGMNQGAMPEKIPYMPDAYKTEHQADNASPGGFSMIDDDEELPF